MHIANMQPNYNLQSNLLFALHFLIHRDGILGLRRHDIMKIK